MFRIFRCRGFEIHMALTSFAKDLYDVSLRIKHSGNSSVPEQCGSDHARLVLSHRRKRGTSRYRFFAPANSREAAARNVLTLPN
ncbi:hypothetical protein [Caballeronia sp. LZ001]|uniref:hypothetical protein n=1 Tax=Caballeronia sp. LZ001 TaxID=3038553 RepID=UPI0028678B07|nr:hypothetical protein [Caballeronia sp. LZ001]MDR5804462.1 hypothetical protein [Caballeronia sp. LZ001]